jgi:hypothetical protein
MLTGMARSPTCGLAPRKTQEEITMRKLLIAAGALAAGVLSLNVPVSLAIGPETGGQQTAANEGMKVTGTVMEVNQDSGEITIGDQTFVMPKESGGASMMPQVGADVTVYYEEKDGKKTVTRIGQAEK